jgi:hypothetical protein
MDCEKFETTLIDELYDELDELTSAAAKRHVAGCARCAALFGGLKATRRIAVLPMVSPSPDLEERILAAAKDAQKVVPLERRLSRAISWAGSWAMRPQTAMAALFLLMIGASSLLLRGRNKASAPSTATMTITAEGSPVGQAATVPAEEVAKVDPTAAAAAHGVLVPPAAAPVPSPTAAASAVALSSPPSPPADLDRKDDGVNALAQNGVRSKSAYGSLGGVGAAGGSSDGIGNAAAPAGAPPPAAHAKPVAIASTPSQASDTAAASDPMAGYAEAKKREARGEAQAAGPAASASPTDGAMALYRSGNFDEAARAFDALAPGDPEAALWAARSVRDGTAGCSAAIPRFDAVASRSFGTRVGYDAVLEGGQCLRQVGSIEMARQHFTRLLTVPSFANRAQAGIDSLSAGQVAARRAAPPAPAKAPAATTTPPAQQQAPARPSQQAPAQKSVSY